MLAREGRHAACQSVKDLMDCRNESTCHKADEPFRRWTPFRTVVLSLATIGTVPILMQGKIAEAFIVWILGWMLTVPSARERMNNRDGLVPYKEGRQCRQWAIQNIVLLSLIVPAMIATLMQGKPLKALIICVLGLILAIPFTKK
jgi:hypothetical protein